MGLSQWSRGHASKCGTNHETANENAEENGQDGSRLPLLTSEKICERKAGWQDALSARPLICTVKARMYRLQM